MITCIWSPLPLWRHKALHSVASDAAKDQHSTACHQSEGGGDDDNDVSDLDNDGIERGPPLAHRYTGAVGDVKVVGADNTGVGLAFSSIICCSFICACGNNIKMIGGIFKLVKTTTLAIAIQSQALLQAQPGWPQQQLYEKLLGQSYLTTDT